MNSHPLNHLARRLWWLVCVVVFATGSVLSQASNQHPCRIDGWLNLSQVWGSVLNGNNARVAEGETVSLRYAVILPSGTANTIYLKLDHTSGDGTPRFFDFFAGPTVSDATAGFGYSSLGTAVEAVIPDDLQVPGDQSNGRLRIFNASVTGFGPYSLVNGVKVLPVHVLVKADGRTKTVLLSYGAHLARGQDSPNGVGSSTYPGNSRKAYASANVDAAVSVTVDKTAFGLTADLEVRQSVLASVVPVGDRAKFTITVRNLGGSSATGVVLQNSDIAGSTTTTQGTVDGSRVLLGTLASGEQALVTVEATVPCGGLSNSATVSSDVIDPVSSNNTVVSPVSSSDALPPVILGLPTTPVIAFAAPTACGTAVSLPLIAASDGCTAIPSLSVTRSDGLGLEVEYPLGVTRVTCVSQDQVGNTSTAVLDVVVLPLNLAWPVATRLLLPEPDPNSGLTSATIEECIGLPSQSRWYKFRVQPGSKLLVTLENLPENYDIVLYKDIQDTYDSLNQVQSVGDLTQLNAEFAADAFAADAFSSEAFAGAAFSGAAFSGAAWSGAAWSGAAWSGAAFSGAAFSGAAWSPDVYAADTFFGAAFSGAAFSGAAWSGAAWSADAVAGAAFSGAAWSGAAWSGAAWSGAAWSGAAWSGAAFSGAAFSTDAVSGAAWSGAAFSGAAFSDAQLRSIVGVSAFPGIGNEAILANTWDNARDFYVRVRGRNGVFAPGRNFKLAVHMLTGACKNIIPLEDLPHSTTVVPTSGVIKSLILVDDTRLATYSGTAAEVSALRSRLQSFAERPEVAGVVLDVGLDARVFAANAQADAEPSCVAAKNIVANAIRDLVTQYRASHPEIESIVLVGNDAILPFFRQPDQGLLANENNYIPPVLNTSASEAALKLGYFLTQDYYGATCELSLKVASLPLLEIGVGRLVETLAEITAQLDAYEQTAAGVVATPTTALVTGYDFLTDAAEAIRGEFQAGLGLGVNELIQPAGETPATGWNADQLRAKLLGSRHDLIFLAGHFSSGGALAADYQTRMTSSELADSSVNLVNSIVFSAGCHSGYNIVNSDAVPQVSPTPDWAQAFAGKGAVLIAGTGYQYGDTEILEYSERLYLNFAQQLRTGTGPVSIGRALARAKAVYLAETPVMRGLHEKALLQATLFGLPMLSLDLPAGRGTPAPDTSIVTALTPAPIPGQTFGLQYADLGIQPTFIENTKELEDLDTPGDNKLIATYFSGGNGVAGNPSEPLFPLEVRNVTVLGSVLRGVGFRSATYEDESDLLPLVSSPATELSGPHTQFLSDILFPIRFWNVNYFDALCAASGSPSEATRLFVMPSQFISRDTEDPFGTFRKFTGLTFRLFYNENSTTYQVTGGQSQASITPALSAPPAILNVSDEVIDSDRVRIRVKVAGNPFAGIQEVWFTYTGVRGTPGFHGRWESLNLTQPDPQGDSTLWEGLLPLNGALPGNLRYLVQAANGVGLVTLDTKLGAYYIPGGTSTLPARASTLTIEPPVSGSAVYSRQVAFRAKLMVDNVPIPGKLITLALGTQETRGVTDANGVATVQLSMLGFPGIYSLRASFAGDDVYRPSQDSLPFTISKGTSALHLTPTGTIFVEAGKPTPFVASLSSDGNPLAERTVFFVFKPLQFDASGQILVDGAGDPVFGSPAYYFPVITDFLGRAALSTLREMLCPMAPMISAFILEVAFRDNPSTRRTPVIRLLRQLGSPNLRPVRLS